MEIYPPTACGMCRIDSPCHHHMGMGGRRRVVAWGHYRRCTGAGARHFSGQVHGGYVRPPRSLIRVRSFCGSPGDRDTVGPIHHRRHSRFRSADALIRWTTTSLLDNPVRPLTSSLGADCGRPAEGPDNASTAHILQPKDLRFPQRLPEAS